MRETCHPVGYLEGSYVRPEYRRQGWARRLLEAGQDWARSLGCREFASDCSLNNTGSIDFHEKTGFAIANRIVCFQKTLPLSIEGIKSPAPASAGAGLFHIPLQPQQGGQQSQEEGQRQHQEPLPEHPPRGHGGYSASWRPMARRESMTPASGAPQQMTLSHTRLRPLSQQSCSQLCIHSPLPHP